MTLKRAAGFTALMVFIFLVVLYLARSSIVELRSRAEQEFFAQRVAELQAIARGDTQPDDSVYVLSAQTAVARLEPLGLPPELPFLRQSDFPTAGSFRHRDRFWVYLAAGDGRYLLSAAPYASVTAWTTGFERREIRNVILVMMAFAAFTLVWMWADQRALRATEKARMVASLEKMVDERTEALKRAHRLARLGEFAASMAHEIRNPLGALVTSAKLMPGSRQDEQRELVEVIHRESGRLDRILKDFLSFSREPQLRPQPTDLNQLLTRGLAALKHSSECDRVEIRFDLDPGLEPLLCDAQQMSQVFWNIALNSAQAMNGKGTLTVSSHLKARWVAIAFTDQGPGIPAEQQEKIFEPFYTRKRGGTGLGLSIASRIVAAHGGFIQVDSRVGEGSCFRIFLPMQNQGKTS